MVTALRQAKRLPEVTGLCKGILMAERVALNFLQRMSGIATLTSAFVKEVAGTGVRYTRYEKNDAGNENSGKVRSSGLAEA